MFGDIVDFLTWNPLFALLPLIAGVALMMFAKHLVGRFDVAGFIWSVIVLLAGGLLASYVGGTAFGAYVGLSRGTLNFELWDLLALILFVLGAVVGWYLELKRPIPTQPAQG